MPPFIFESAFSIRIFLVSAFLPEVTQQIHSLRASGVILSHKALTLGAPIIAFSKSRGTLCTTPFEIFAVIISTIPSSLNLSHFTVLTRSHLTRIVNYRSPSKPTLLKGEFHEQVPRCCCRLPRAFRGKYRGSPGLSLLSRLAVHPEWADVPAVRRHHAHVSWARVRRAAALSGSGTAVLPTGAASGRRHGNVPRADLSAGAAMGSPATKDFHLPQVMVHSTPPLPRGLFYTKNNKIK